MQKIIVLSCGIFILFITSIYAQKEDSRKKVDSTLVLVHGDGLFINLSSAKVSAADFCAISSPKPRPLLSSVNTNKLRFFSGH